MNFYLFRPIFGNAISHLCDKLALYVKRFAIEWLLILPLYHLFLERIEFCGKPTFDRDVDMNVYNKLGIQPLAKKAASEKL